MSGAFSRSSPYSTLLPFPSRIMSKCQRYLPAIESLLRKRNGVVGPLFDLEDAPRLEVHDLRRRLVTTLADLPNDQLGLAHSVCRLMSET